MRLARKVYGRCILVLITRRMAFILEKDMVEYNEAIRIEEQFRMNSGTEYKRIVVKIGSSSLTHEETGKLDLGKMFVWSVPVQSPWDVLRWAFMSDRRKFR